MRRLERVIMEQWEYKIVYVNVRGRTATGLPPELNEDFDRWGAEGWELVATEYLTRWVAPDGLIAFFKRRVGVQAGGGNARQ
jgi:Domain of unknown function (DUF4177)